MFTHRLLGALLPALVACGCQAQRPADALVAEALAPSSMPRSLYGVVEGHGAQARLDLLGRGPQEARAFLRVSRGAGHGYLYDGFYFARTRYDAASGRIEGTNDRCTLRGTAASLGVMCGERKLTVRLDGPVPRALASSAVGHYVGTCGGVKQHASVSATWEQDAYLLTLMRAPEGARLADMLTARADATASDRVTFRHASKPSSCDLSGARLVCDACTMAPLAEDHSDAPVAARDEDQEADEAVAALPTSGQYYGHLVHDGSGRSQLVAVNFNSGEDAVLENLDSALTTKDGPVVLQYFGAGDSSDFVAFRSGPQTGAVLESDGDAVLAFDRKGGETVGGVWYSKAFGRVGRFTLERELVPELQDGSTLVPQLSGFYRAGAWTLELAAVAGDATTAAARGMRLPLFGHVHDSQPASRRRAIVGGAYDPLSGQVALRLDDGRVIAGHAEASALVLHWVSWASMDGFGSAGGVLRFERSAAPPPGRTARSRN